MQPFEIACVCGAGTFWENDMARRTKSTIVGAVADSVTDAVSTAIDALAHPAMTVAQAREAILGATRKAAAAATRRATSAKRRKVAAKKGAAKRAIKKAAKKVRRR
jgi:hypothetical protein